MMSNKKHFILNLISSYGNTLINIVLNFVSVPIILNYWDKELYGVWTIIVSFSVYISASGLGIDNSTGILATKNSNYETKLSIIKKGFKLLLLCSLVLGIILFLLTLIFPDWLRLIGKMSDENYTIARVAALIFLIGTIINLPFNTIANSLQSIGKAYLTTSVGTIQIILNFIIILIVVNLHLTLPVYVILTSTNTIFCSVIKLILFCIYYKKGYNEWKSKSSQEDLVPTKTNDNSYKTILLTGLNMSLYGLAIMITTNISNLIITNYVDVKSIVPYSMSYKLFSTIAFLWNSLNIALAPLLGAEFGKNNWDWIKENYNRIFKCTVSLSSFLILGVIWFSKPFILLWTKSIDNYPGNLISITLGCFYILCALANLNLVIVNAFNYVKKIWIISWLDCLVFIIVSVSLTKTIGVIGVPIGLLSGALIVSGWAYPLVVYLRSNKQLKYDFKYLGFNLMIFAVSILLYICISNNIYSLHLEVFLDFVGMILTTIFIFMVIPKDIKSRFKNRVLRGKK